MKQQRRLVALRFSISKRVLVKYKFLFYYLIRTLQFAQLDIW